MGGIKIGRAVGAAVAATCLAATTAACGSSSDPQGGSASGGAKEPYKVALSMSYSGNDWQTIAANLIKAQAKTGDYAGRVELKEDVAGTAVPDQIRTIQNEVAAGMDAIILYPLSPTALNATIEKACQRGVKVITYDSYVTAPCAYNVRDNVEEMGYQSMKWLAGEVKAAGKTEIGMLTGVPGTTAETEYQKGVDRALKEVTGVQVVAREPGLWDPAKAKSSFSSIYAAHPNIGGVWGIYACGSVDQVLTAQKALQR
jgi:ribose transport system substrate-binding protein